MQFTADNAHVGEHYPDPEHLDEHGLPYVEWTILDVDTFTPAEGHEPDVLLTSDGPYVRGGTTIRVLASRADYRELDTSPDAPEPLMFAGVPLPGVLPTTHMVGGWTAEEIAAAHQRRLDRSERWLHDTRDLVASSRNRHSAESVMTWAAGQRPDADRQLRRAQRRVPADQQPRRAAARPGAGARRPGRADHRAAGAAGRAAARRRQPGVSHPPSAPAPSASGPERARRGGSKAHTTGMRETAAATAARARGLPRRRGC